MRMDRVAVILFLSLCFIAARVSADVQTFQWALQFRGTSNDLGNGQIAAQSKATTEIVTSLINPSDGPSIQIQSLPGSIAVFSSIVKTLTETTFYESGNITFGVHQSLVDGITFATVGQGTLVPSPIDGILQGSAYYNVTGGFGMFAGASGFVTSNFQINSTDNTYVDFEFGNVYVSSD
eukprot:TRINITY_DN2338_c0_g1_i1.p1 TRINITY_DN2338_c0_g1~~TRINITY_DN2338_c0_g1_i1.p1  ORF type:complete len:199 (-),score=32.80 TRINITY_DN2338_c0_g1_i1:43-579(-)